MKKSTFTLLGLASLVIILTSGIKGTTDKNGRTGSTTSGCGGGGCHTTQGGTVTLTGLAASVLPSTQYTFSLVYTPPSAQTFWGLDLKPSTGTIVAGTGMKKSGTDITHSSPLGGTSAASFTYSNIKWTSPAAVGAVTFNFACVGNTTTSTPSGAYWQTGTFSTTVVLPVEIVSFTAAKLDGNKVAISWQTAVEINCDHFEVEKSTDGKTFTTISKVAAAGNSSVSKSYTANDVLENNTTATYYRLKTVDKNGDFGYSNIQSINTKVNTTLNSIYPNPAKKGQDINVELTSDKEQNINFVLINGQGKIVSNKQKTVKQGYNKISFQFGNYLVNGNYYLQAKVGNILLNPANISIVE